MPFTQICQARTAGEFAGGYTAALSASMRQVLNKREEIRTSAEKYAVTKTYWAIVGSGSNKVSADEIDPAIAGLNEGLRRAREQLAQTQAAAEESWDEFSGDLDETIEDLREIWSAEDGGASDD